MLPPTLLLALLALYALLALLAWFWLRTRRPDLTPAERRRYATAWLPCLVAIGVFIALFFLADVLQEGEAEDEGL